MWYYIRAGESQGPFDERAFDDLVAQGAITADALVWREGMASWLPLRQARPAPVTNSTCAICHASVGTDNLIDLAGIRVCAACKPMAVQRMREGVGLTADGTAWCDGKKLVVQDAAQLPPRCVKCNAATTNPPLKRKFLWHPPAYYLFVLVNLLLYILIAICVRKRGSAEIYLCTHHRSRRRGFILGAWGAGALGIGLIITGGIMNIVALIGIGVLVAIAAFFGGFFGATILRTSRIKGKTIWLAGAGPDFLASLPPWSARIDP